MCILYLTFTGSVHMNKEKNPQSYQVQCQLKPVCQVIYTHIQQWLRGWPELPRSDWMMAKTGEEVQSVLERAKEWKSVSLKFIFIYSIKAISHYLKKMVTVKSLQFMFKQGKGQI